MTHYRKLTVFSVLLAVVALLTVLAAGASADWFPGDGHKMHFPQLPDPDPLHGQETRLAGWQLRILLS